MKNRQQVNEGIGIFGIVQIVFIILKLCGLINWNWFWVLSPMIIYIILFLLVLLIVGIVIKIKR